MIEKSGAHPSQIGTIHTTMQSWHEDVVVWRRYVGRVCNEAAGWDVTHALEETAVVYLQHR